MTPERWSLITSERGWLLGAWLLRAVLIGIVAWGFVIGRLALVVNAGVGLLATCGPLLLRRRWGAAVPRSVDWWVGLAAAAHAGGLVGGLYAPPTRFDLVTHTLSGGVVAVCFLVIIRGYDRSTDQVYLPQWFRILMGVVVVMAAGVVWELLESMVGGGGGIQTSLADTVTDTVANVVGGVVAIGSSRLAKWRSDAYSSTALVERANE